MNFQFRFNKEFLLEFLAVISSILYTVLITYEIIWCWLAALIASALFIYLVLNKDLYAETVLHFFYFIMAIYGWRTWESAGNFQIVSWGFQTNISLVIIAFMIVLITGFLLKRYTPAQLPYVDSFTTIFSFIATYMMIHMVLENWLYWIVIDSVSVYLYAKRKLYLGAMLYFIYTALAINGYFSWLNG